MRQPRFTYPGAFHHCMNRGINGEAILVGEKLKTAFLDLLADKVFKYRMRIFAYAILDTHYLPVLENASGRMSDFSRNLNAAMLLITANTRAAKGMCSKAVSSQLSSRTMRI